MPIQVDGRLLLNRSWCLAHSTLPSLILCANSRPYIFILVHFLENVHNVPPDIRVAFDISYLHIVHADWWVDLSWRTTHQGDDYLGRCVTGRSNDAGPLGNVRLLPADTCFPEMGLRNRHAFDHNLRVVGWREIHSWRRSIDSASFTRFTALFDDNLYVRPPDLKSISLTDSSLSNARSGPTGRRERE